MSSEAKKRSFLKSLFCGTIEEDIVFPFPKMEAEEAENVRMVLESLTKFAEDKIDPVKIDREGHIPDEVMGGLADLGLFGTIIPEEYGGFGLSQTAYARVFEAIGATDASISATIGAHTSIGLKGIILYGTEQQKRKYLPKLATGEHLAAFALTEPTSGSDAASIRSTAVLNQEGTHYILNGDKLWITNGGLADIITVFAQTEVEDKGEKKKKITAFIVERQMEGFSSGKEEKKLGIKGSSTTALFFDNVKIPVENVLGEVGKGFKVAMEILNDGRLGLGAGCVGGAKGVLELSAGYAKERIQFGQPIANFEMIQDKIARMAMEIFAMDSMVYLTTGLVDRGDIDYSLESAVCKIYCSESLWRVVNECLQINAGNGYMKDYPYERFLRDSRINIIFEGTNEILRMLIALSGMQVPGEYLKEVAKALEHPIESIGLLSDFAVRKIKRAVISERISCVNPILQKEAGRVSEYTRVIADEVEGALRKYGKKIVEKEFIQKRISDMAIDIYAMVSVISRVDSLINEKGEDNVQTEISLCKAYCNQAWRRVRRNARQVTSNDDEILSQLANDVYQSNGYRF